MDLRVLFAILLGASIGAIAIQFILQKRHENLNKVKKLQKNDLTKYGTFEKTPEYLAAKKFESYDLTPGRYGPFTLGMTKDDISKQIGIKHKFKPAPGSEKIQSDDLELQFTRVKIHAGFIFSKDAQGEYVLSRIYQKTGSAFEDLEALYGDRLQPMKSKQPYIKQYGVYDETQGATLVFKVFRHELFDISTSREHV